MTYALEQERELNSPPSTTRAQVLAPTGSQSVQELTWLEYAKQESLKKAIHRESRHFVGTPSTMDAKAAISWIVEKMKGEIVKYAEQEETPATPVAESATSSEDAERLEGTWWHRFSRSLGEMWKGYWQGHAISEWETTMAEWHGVPASMGPVIAAQLMERLSSVPKLSGEVR
jgi:hypothetical protein